MIGHFKSVESADAFIKELESLKEQVAKGIPSGRGEEPFPDELLDKLVHGDYAFCQDLVPRDLSDLEMSLDYEKSEGDPSTVKFTSSDTGWAGLIKMMVNAGAKVEVFDETLCKKEDDK